MTFFATENHSATALGTNISFTTTPNGSVTSLERMRIDQNGNVGIGTATPASPLTVATGPGEFTPALAVLPSTHATSRGAMLLLDQWAVLQDLNGPAYTLQVNCAVAGASAYVSTSDKRLKKDIEPISYGLAEVRRLHLVAFQWKDQRPDWAKGRKLGLIAQKVDPTVPEVVSTAHDKIGTKSIAYGDLTPVLIHAVQELAADNDNLRTELENLRRKIDASHSGN
jgi:hypothetical protein